MTRWIIIFTIGLFTYFSCSWGDKNEEDGKILIVRGTIEQWNEVWEVIDTSASGNLKVKRVKAFIFGQLSLQIDTTKK